MSSPSLPTSSTPESNSTPQPSQLDLDDDWILVSQDWWKLPFHDVSWHHRNKLQWSQDGVFLPHYPTPLHYHAHLFSDKDSTIAQAYRLSLPIQGQPAPPTSGTKDLELSPALIGVKLVEDVINRYELDVGIIHPQVPSATTPSQAEASLRPSVLFNGQITPSDLLQIRNYWESLATSFLGISSPRPSLSSHLFAAPPLALNGVKLWDLNALEDPLSFSSAIVADATRSPTKAKFRKGVGPGTRPVHPTSSRNSRSPDGALLDLTDSELSADSDPQPPTPYSEKKSYAAALVYDDHGHVHPTRRRLSLHQGRNVVVAPSPSKPLNAAALSFIPAATTAPTSQLDDSNPQHHSLSSPLLSSTTGTTTNDSTSPYTPTYEFHFPSLTSQPIITSSPTRTRKPSSGHRHNQSVTSPSKTGDVPTRKQDEERDRSSSLSGLDENDRLGARSLPPNLRKDDQGFYTEVSHSSSAMPASLVSRPLSSSANLGLGAPPSGDSGATSGSSVITGGGSGKAAFDIVGPSGFFGRVGEWVWRRE
ncbi:hypothetical protein NLI96_g6357 [Meripilus lineatus]|uniref:Uncharacterized protein n=1 Tax=Meripilus lineatus TaxID=2056292 RepID=A0AAD5V0Z7_9APHY|nr:hypothetical protein NLI96_g6357 [Physisporinus lineatus]